MLTGGHILGGFHEVVYNERTEEAYQKAKENKRSIWRVSSTLFSHMRSDVLLEPLGKYKDLVRNALDYKLKSELGGRKQIQASNCS